MLATPDTPRQPPTSRRHLLNIINLRLYATITTPERRQRFTLHQATVRYLPPMPSPYGYHIIAV